MFANVGILDANKIYTKILTRAAIRLKILIAINRVIKIFNRD